MNENQTPRSDEMSEMYDSAEPEVTTPDMLRLRPVAEKHTKEPRISDEELRKLQFGLCALTDQPYPVENVEFTFKEAVGVINDLVDARAELKRYKGLNPEAIAEAVEYVRQDADSCPTGLVGCDCRYCRARAIAAKLEADHD
jgi:hypothetical protein